MKIQMQPINSNTCGHHCVAMIASVPAAEVIQTIGHERGTFVHELIKALNHYGFTTGSKLERIHKSEKLPRLCILKLYFEDQTNTHWVVHSAGEILDPACGEYYFNTRFMNMIRARATSYLVIHSKT